MIITNNIKYSYNRIKPFINNTPLIRVNKENLDNSNNNIFLKLDSKQITGSFKIRGLLNHILSLQEQKKILKGVVSYSTGNHAISLSFLGKMFNFKVLIYLAKNVLESKKQLIKSLKAQVIEVASREEAERAAIALSRNNKDYIYVSTSNNHEIINGAGTMCYESLLELKKLKYKCDIIFVPIGGGGLIAGSYLARDLVSKTTEIIGVEPKNANDAYLSLKKKKIHRLSCDPITIADGLRALSVSEKAFEYIKKINTIELVSESSIKYWTNYLDRIGIQCEPSGAIAFAAAQTWLKKKKISNANILVLITGNNT